MNAAHEAIAREEAEKGLSDPEAQIAKLLIVKLSLLNDLRVGAS